MTVKWEPSDPDDLLRRHAAGETVHALARREGVSDGVVKRFLVDRGIAVRTINWAADDPRTLAVQERRRRGDTMNAIAADFGIKNVTVSNLLKRHGDPHPGGRFTPADEAVIVADYCDGTSELSLARKHGCDRAVIRRIITQAGVTPRNGSEAQFHRYFGTTAEERKAITRNANNAVRGKTLTWDKRLRDAVGRQRTMAMATEQEHVIAAELRRRGLVVEQQTAIGPYNCDLTIAAGSVAVEIFGGGWHWSGNHAARHRKRGAYILDQGWHLICLVIDLKRPLTVGGYDYLVAFAEFAHRNPSAGREYRVVGGTGQDLPGIRPDLNPLTLVRPDE